MGCDGTRGCQYQDDSSDEDCQPINRKIKSLKKTNDKLTNAISAINTQNQELQSKVDSLEEKLNMVCAWIELTEKKA